MLMKKCQLASAPVVFFCHWPKCFWNDWKKLCHSGQNIWKYRLMNIVTARFDTIVRKITEMSQW